MRRAWIEAARSEEVRHAARGWARARAIEEHSAYRRAGELLALLEETAVEAAKGDGLRDTRPGALPASPRSASVA